MPDDRWSRIQDLVLDTLKLREQERSSFLDRECGNDADLRAEVESLLMYEKEAPDLIESLSRFAFRMLADQPDELASLPPVTAQDFTGETVAHFQILEKLGEGGMGVVYKAFDTRLQRTVALKFLLRSAVDPSRNYLDGGATFTQSPSDSYREARAASALDHPNICTVYEVGEHEGIPFISMQLLTGETLRQRIDTRQIDAQQIDAQRTDPGRMSLPEALELAMQVTAALDAAHNAGVLHCDIKPANIFITERGEAKVLDFGLATRMHRSNRVDLKSTDASAPFPTPFETGLHAIAGTAAYMSPEQVQGGQPDVHGDIFSFGIVLYEMTTGASPFKGQDSAQTFDNILRETPLRPSQWNREIPPELDRIIAKSLEKNPIDRYQTIAALRDDLRQLIASQKTAPSPSTRTRNWLIAAAAVIALAVSSYAIYKALHAPPRLIPGGDYTIVLGDFANTTDDPIFNYTLRESMRVQLEQSPFLDILSDSRINRELAYMERPANSPLSEEVVRQICLRTGSKATVTGTVTRLGSEYVLQATATGCQNGEHLGIAQVQVKSRENVLKGLDTISATLRSKLGESLASIQAYDKPVEEATTHSLEALQAYSLGIKMGYAEGKSAAIPYFSSAIQIDPHFAMAYAKLGAAYIALDSPTRPLAPIQRAYELRDRVSDRERFYIESHYFDTVTGEQNKAIVVLQLWQNTYPLDPVPHTNLGVAYGYLGRHPEALRELIEAQRLEPTNGLIYANLASEYLTLNQFANCSKTITEAQRRKVNNPVFIGLNYQLAFLRKDEHAMSDQITHSLGHPWIEGWMLATQADSDADRGQLSEARKHSDEAVSSARKYDGEDTALGYIAVAALREAEYGNRPRVRSMAQTLLTGTTGEVVQIYATLALARAGERNQALAAAHDLNQKYPRDTLLNFYWMPTIQAAIALSDHKPGEAIRILQTTLPYELGAPKSPTNVVGYPIYLRGVACLAAGQNVEAAAEFQKLLDHPGLLGNYQLGGLARLGLARAYRAQAGLSNDKPGAGKMKQPAGGVAATTALRKSKASYAEFLQLWKQADAANPLLIQARAELSTLGNL